ncbi:DUF3082 domain-containing protein [Calothrix sp. NIES-3974]|uniref:DUF3082 domain-containing protein n=1 Tax=Calothrix sp. NIES-3974 TaxID=2005462 RepID=UPI000B5DD181|nr:DUF3082 domain-containing protein [Calothrix sp. NIES-3974]BAZ08032.1 hypothetical protein NIES3974_47010 [Calothrix sp. NIES-3974]
MNEPNLTEKSATEKQTTPLRCFTGAFISAGLAYAGYNMMIAIATSFAEKPLHSDNQIVMRISIAVRTLVVGVVSLGTGVFTIVGLGLFILGLQLLVQGKKNQES